eukprot:COSAG01_NODE_1761_length_9297_cov_17.806262_4_plen_83_part_00
MSEKGPFWGNKGQALVLRFSSTALVLRRLNLNPTLLAAQLPSSSRSSASTAGGSSSSSPRPHPPTRGPRAPRSPAVCVQQRK